MRTIGVTIGFLAALAAYGQTATNGTPAPAPAAQGAPAAPPTPPADPPAPTAYSYKGFNFSGWADGYYSNDSNYPTDGIIPLQAFTYTASKFSLNSGTGSFSYDPKPIGFRLDIGYGSTYTSFYASEPVKSPWNKYTTNAYVSLKPQSWKGFELDFGKFTTSAGAEVTETYLNYNYSRSLLFNYGPFFHFGIRTSMPINERWTAGFQLVQGWNDVKDNNTAKTMVFTSSNTFNSKYSMANTYIAGPENTGTNSGWRNFYDFVFNANPNKVVSSYLNVDVGQNNGPNGAPSAFFWGIAGAARFQLTPRVAVSPRLEYYDDANGYMTGVAHAIKEVTITGEYKLNDSLIARVEWRNDWSNQAFFQMGSGQNPAYHQNLLTVGLIAVVRPGFLKFGKS